MLVACRSSTSLAVSDNHFWHSAVRIFFAPSGVVVCTLANSVPMSLHICSTWASRVVSSKCSDWSLLMAITIHILERVQRIPNY